LFLERVLKVASKIQHTVNYNYFDMAKKDAQPRKTLPHEFKSETLGHYQAVVARRQTGRTPALDKSTAGAE
jgi:hypothetical protein